MHILDKRWSQKRLDGYATKDTIKEPQIVFDFMKKAATGNASEDYTVSPPALAVVDERGNVFTLGFQYIVSGGEFAFPVLVNGVATSFWANRIERRNKRVKIFGPEADGARVHTWNGQAFV